MTAAPLSLRPARPGDREELLEMLHRMMVEIVGEEAAAPLQAITRQDMEAALAGGGDQLLLVAEANEGLAACGRIRVLPYHPMYRFSPSQEYGYVEWMFVRPEHRGEGLGSRLLDALERWAEERGLCQLTLHNSPEARTLYERAGYRPLPEMGKATGRGRKPKCH